MSDYEVHPVGTAAKIARLLADLLGRQTAKQYCAAAESLNTIRELSEARQAALRALADCGPSDKELRNAARSLRDFYGLSPETARLYAETALEAAYAARGKE